MTGPPSSSGLGFRPFKAATRVRIPLGAHNRIAHAPVEESGRPHRPVKAEIAGSKPVGRAGQRRYREVPPLSCGQVCGQQSAAALFRLATHRRRTRIGSSSSALARHDPSWLDSPRAPSSRRRSGVRGRTNALNQRPRGRTPRAAHRGMRRRTPGGSSCWASIRPMSASLDGSRVAGTA
jgi:hypothetical protein